MDDVEDVDLLLLVGNGEQSGAGEAQSRALRRLGVDGPEHSAVKSDTRSRRMTGLEVRADTSLHSDSVFFLVEDILDEFR